MQTVLIFFENKKAMKQTIYTKVIKAMLTQARTDMRNTERVMQK